MSCPQDILRDGTNQLDRLLDSLKPENIQIDGRSPEDIVQLWVQLAEQFRYFGLNDQDQGNWQSVLPSQNQLLSFWANGPQLQDVEPSIALLFAFHEMMGFLKNDLNGLTAKHLNYYYKDLLRFAPKEAQAEQVHLILEPAKNVASHRIAEGTLFDGGKDINGQERLYATTKDIILHPAKLPSFRSVYVDKEDFCRLYAANVANSLDGKGAELDELDPKWPAFGADQKGRTQEEQNMEKATVGFAIASPQLLLGDGKRDITFIIRCDKNDPAATYDVSLAQALNLELSTPEGWFQPAFSKAEIVSQSADEVKIELQVILAKTDPSIVGLAQSSLAGSLPTDLPVAKLTLSHAPSKYRYEQLKDLTVRTMEINLAVEGKKKLTLQNDTGALDPNKPFFPFTPQPDRGSSLIIGSAEVFSKKLDNVQLKYQWEKLPETDFDNYYGEYDLPSEQVDNQLFKAEIDLLNGQEWERIGPTELNLFNDSNAAPQVALPSTQLASSMDRVQGLEEGTLYQVDAKYGFLRVRFLGGKDVGGAYLDNMRAFGHQEFTALYTDAAVTKARDGAGADVFPNTPYTPLMSGLALDYCSNQSLDFHPENGQEQFFYIHPFGYEANQKTQHFALLPDYDEQGNFYIGIENIQPPLNLSLLFQVGEGSAEADPTTLPEPITWSYLGQDGWKEFDPLSILVDSTRGLQNSGIIEFAIGKQAVVSSGLFPDDLYWIRGSIPSFVSGVSQLVEVVPNAITASYVFPEEATVKDELYVEPIRFLLAGEIKKLKVKDGKVKKVKQPYDSFGGQSIEREEAFLTRVSERVRHKKRAINVWDYEHMVLEAFPTIFKVKCLEHASATSDHAPGATTLLVVSNLRNTNSNTSNRLAPKIGFDTILKVKEFLQPYVSPFVDLHVANPIYEQLLVDFKVAFYPELDAGFFANRLNKDLQEYLSPWAFEEGEDIVFGGRIRRSDILAFIENRDYVDYVTEFKLYHIYDGSVQGGVGCMVIEDDFVISDFENFQGLGLGEMALEQDFVIGRETEVARANSPRSILVSAPEHRIEILTAGVHTCKGGTFGGIGSMAIEIDFITN